MASFRRLRAQVAIARFVAAGLRRSGRGGTSLPGKLLLRMAPDAIGHLAARLPDGSAAISATNGKTTTAALVATMLARTDRTIVHNHAGANMAGGIAGALIEAPHAADCGLFEIDEMWLDGLVDELRPRALMLGNLFRDQLDRYGELETIVERWDLLCLRATDTQLVLNADDPIIADLGRRRDPDDGGVLYFGIADRSVALSEHPHAADAIYCRRCGAPYSYDAVLLGHLGHYRCEHCGAERPQPQVIAEQVVLDGLRGSQLTIKTPVGTIRATIPLPGLYNAYNALAAVALAIALELSAEAITTGLADGGPAFGRAETIAVSGRELLMMLVKNPTGANEVIRTLRSEPGEHQVLAVLNDRIADGRDVSWVWDADYELLVGHIAEVVCSGTRAAELAVRFKYAGLAPERIIVEPALESALERALTGGNGQLVAIPTYTAMIELRDLLVARGVAESSF